MAVLVVQKPELSPTATTLAFASGTAAGDSFPNTGIEYVHVVNTGSTQKIITFDSPGTCSFALAANAAHDLAGLVPPVASAPSNRKVFGPFPRTRFNDGNERVVITIDDASGITLAVQSAQ